MNKQYVSGEADAVHLSLLDLLSTQPETSQREMSRRLGWSVGKTHYLLGALLEKGLIKAQNFRDSRNKAGYAYYLTPEGFRKKAALMRSFLARKEREFEVLQEEIHRLRMALQHGRAAESSDAVAAPSDP